MTEFILRAPSEDRWQQKLMACDTAAEVDDLHGGAELNHKLHVQPYPTKLRQMTARRRAEIARQR